MGILRLVQRGAARRVLSLALPLPLLACAVGPDYIPPAAPATDKFLVAGKQSIKTGHQDDHDWWRGFHDPTLNQLIQSAYHENLTVLSAGTRVLQARATLGTAAG